MLSYRHAFHAGNHADVLKHTVQSLIIEALKQKEKPIFYLDTHAGAGCYALNTQQAQKTGDYLSGIARLWPPKDVPPLLKPYLNAVAAVNPGVQLSHYPGSPLIARHLLRPHDRLSLAELHPTDFACLQQACRADRRINAWHVDGYQQLKTQLPPPCRRGLIMIDPPYEVKSDYQTVIIALQIGYRRFSSGVYVLWYPVVQRQRIDYLLQQLKVSHLAPLLQIELAVSPDNDQLGMTASGVLVLNPPWTLAQQMAELLPWLQQKLYSTQQGGFSTLRWITAERPT